MMKQFARLVLAFWLTGWAIMPVSHAEPASQPVSQPSSSVTRAIPYKTEPKSFENQMGQSLLMLLLVIGIAAAFLYAAKKYLPRLNIRANSSNRLRLIETLHLTTKTTLFVVRFDNTTLLLAQHGESINVLSTQATDQPSSNPPQA